MRNTKYKIRNKKTQKIIPSSTFSYSICTSYYTLSMAYCVYCTRPEGAKRPRACAVKYAIRHLRACSKWFIAI